MIRNHSGRLETEISSLSAIEHILRHVPDRIKSLSSFDSVNLKSPRIAEIHGLAKKAHIKIDVSPGKGREGEQMRAIIHPYRYLELSELVDKANERPRSLLLALDHLQDPQNFGAICRTANGLGATGVIIPKDRAVAVSQGVYHASVGAVETLSIALVVNLGDALRKLKEQGFWIVGTSLGKSASQPGDMPDFEKVVLVMGTELDGMSNAIEKTCDWHVEIPLVGKVQSLNVSVAAGLMMYELLNVRRRATRS